MREGEPSGTATLVAVCRGLAPRVRDPHAAALVPSRVRPLVEAGMRSRLVREAARVASGGVVDHVALRTATIDEALREAVAAGCGQVVVLGAGLDARAWRLALGVPFFEVDHPDTQRRKAQRAPTEGAPRYVAVDFATTRVADALEAAGHDATVPTAWVWEGVTMYLPDVAVRDTLAQLGERSAPGSRLVISYLAEDGVPLAPAVRLGFRMLFGEPLEARYRPAEMRALLEGAGFEVRFDGDSRDWLRDWGGHPRLARLLRGERLAVAERAAVAAR